MLTTTYTLETPKDAGLYREYIGIRYGQVFEFGGEASIYFRGVAHATRLAKMIGFTTEQVIAQAIQDRRDAEDMLAAG